MVMLIAKHTLLQLSCALISWKCTYQAIHMHSFWANKKSGPTPILTLASLEVILSFNWLKATEILSWFAKTMKKKKNPIHKRALLFSLLGVFVFLGTQFLFQLISPCFKVQFFISFYFVFICFLMGSEICTPIFANHTPCLLKLPNYPYLLITFPTCPFSLFTYSFFDEPSFFCSKCFSKDAVGLKSFTWNWYQNQTHRLPSSTSLLSSSPLSHYMKLVPSTAFATLPPALRTASRPSLSVALLSTTITRSIIENTMLSAAENLCTVQRRTTKTHRRSCCFSSAMPSSSSHNKTSNLHDFSRPHIDL